MTDKSEFVDMISEATRQVRRRIVRRVVEPEVKGSIAPRPPLGPDGAVAAGNVHAVEAQGVEIQGLGLSGHFVRQIEIRRPSGRLIHFSRIAHNRSASGGMPSGDATGDKRQTLRGP